MNSILITGCNRGLGLGLIKAFAALPKPPKHLIATCRNLEQATELRNLAEAHDNIHILEIDLRNYDSHENLVKQVDELTESKGLNVLFNNAGIAPKSTRLTGLRETDLTDALQINTVVPIMLTKAFLPLLKKASKAFEGTSMSVERSAIINMSSIMGSIGNDNQGTRIPYRISKAAINSATKSMAIELYPNQILCIALHPGWVRTDMGGAQAPLDVHTSTTKIVETLMNFNESHTGGFYNYDGVKLPW